MREITTIIILTLISSIGICQNENENLLYVVDSIPVIEEPKEGFGVLNENEINTVEVIRDKTTLEKSGFENLDGIVYIITNEYVNRSDSIKSIPTTKIMNKVNGTWYLLNDTKPYSGPFIDYYLNGKKQGEGILFNGRLKGVRLMYYINGIVSDRIEYENGLPNGTEERFYEDGTLMHKGNTKNGIEVGVWEMFHPNGQLKQRTNFVNGKMDGESVSYYSTGELIGKILYKNGVYQKDKNNDKIYNIYQKGQEYFKQGNFSAAIKKYTKCIELKHNWADGYFARATAKLNNLEFDEAKQDFDITLEIEPYYTNAYANRAFSIIRKYEIGNGKTLSKSKDVTVIASKKVEIPESELTKICADLKKAISLGDDSWMVMETLEKYCDK